VADTPKVTPGSAIAAWQAALRSGEVLPRRQAAEELARSARGAIDGLGVPAELRHGLADTDSTVRWWSAFGLGACPSEPETIAALAGSLADQDRTVRDAAAFALQFHGGAARPALPALLRSLNDSDAGARESARMALLALAPVELPNWPALRTALPHISDELPELAREALAWLEANRS
jgi:HEAT repeat protein